MLTRGTARAGVAPAEATHVAVLEAVGVTKFYGETTALDGVDLAVQPGTLHGLLGPNGAGKTTLLSAVLGLTRADEGAIRLFGRTRADAGSSWLDGVGGFVDAARFYPYLSGRANLTVLAGLDGAGDEGLVDGLLEQVGLGDAGRRKVRGYSLGMRQRLGLAAALLRRPRLLVLDEPTNGLDPAGIRDLTSALRGLADRGVAILLSSHDMRQVEDLCDVVTVLARGRTVWSGPLAQMRADAPDPVWRLRVSRPAAVAEVAATVPGVTLLPEGDDGELACSGPQAAMDDLVIGLGGRGVAVRGLRLDSTPLSAFFFSLTEDRGPGE